MYSLVPAIVSIIIFWVLSPKSANLMRGSGFPATYFVLSRIFSGLRSRWVIRWLCNSWTPLLTCKIQSKLYFSFILLSLQRLSASLLHELSTTVNHPSNTLWCTIQHPAGQWCRRFLECFNYRLFAIPRWSTSPWRCLRGLPDSFWPCGLPTNRWVRYRIHERPAW